MDHGRERSGDTVSMLQDEDLLLALLNSAPAVDGRISEGLDGEAGRAFVDRFGGNGSSGERLALERMRGALQRIVRGAAAEFELAGPLTSTVLVPRVSSSGIHWEPSAAPDDLLPARAAIAWSSVTADLPGRLRACANTECNLFLLDRSRPGTARWCSMATCGNRMKARAHAERHRASARSDA